MNTLTVENLFLLLVVLLFLSAFFSGSETSLMSVNRYKLRHKYKQGSNSAKRVLYLLNNTDRTLGLILLLNNFVNILASAITTLIAIKLYGETAIALSAGILTFVILIFSEVTPKTFAALYPDKIAYPVSLFFYPMLKLFYPLIAIINFFSRMLLGIFGVNQKNKSHELLTKDEIKTIVRESSDHIPKYYEDMIVNMLDLEKVKVEDAMIPRNEVIAIDIEDNIKKISEQILDYKHTRIPIYKNELSSLKGFLHKRKVIKMLVEDNITKERILSSLTPPYFIPEDTSLTSQLIAFKREKKRIGFVVDEYGDVKGLVTLDDILEEIVGEFSQDNKEKDVVRIDSNTYILDGSAQIREVNKILSRKIPESNAKTINGYILECLGDIPERGVLFQTSDYSFEIMKVKNNFVKNVKITKR